MYYLCNYKNFVAAREANMLSCFERVKACKVLEVNLHALLTTTVGVIIIIIMLILLLLLLLLLTRTAAWSWNPDRNICLNGVVRHDLTL
jgi:hypothetical protein